MWGQALGSYAKWLAGQQGESSTIYPGQTLRCDDIATFNDCFITSTTDGIVITNRELSFREELQEETDEWLEEFN